MWELADNRQDDYAKIDDVPAVFEVVFSECDGFHNKFQEKDEYEHEMNPVKGLFCLDALIIWFHCQTQNVQADDGNHDNFKTWFGHQVEEPSLAPVLRTERLNEMMLQYCQTF